VKPEALFVAQRKKTLENLSKRKEFLLRYLKNKDNILKD